MLRINTGKMPVPPDQASKPLNSWWICRSMELLKSIAAKGRLALSFTLASSTCTVPVMPMPIALNPKENV